MGNYCCGEKDKYSEPEVEHLNYQGPFTYGTMFHYHKSYHHTSHHNFDKNIIK